MKKPAFKNKIQKPASKAKTKKIEIKKITAKTSKAAKIAVRKIEKQPVKPAKLAEKIATKIRQKVLNAKEVEAAIAPLPPAPAKPKEKIKPKGAAKPEENEFELKKTKIRIVGIGGGGSNIVAEIAAKVKKSSFWVANTDFAALAQMPKTVSVFHFGESFTQGLGTGMDARLAEEAATEARDRIKKIMEGQDLVILVASLGGGAGSGAAPVFAQISKSMGNLTYGIFTLPFEFEGAKKAEIAKAALEKLRPHMNAITILPNERAFEVVSKSMPFSKTLSHINNSLSDSLEGLIETIYNTGMINIDFADLRAILIGNGKMAFLNTIYLKKGEESNLDSFEKVFDSPLYPYTIDKARGLLLNIVAQKDLKLLDVNKILTAAAGRIHKDSKIIFGVSHEGAAADAARVTVLATGCAYAGAGNGTDSEKEILPPPPKKPAPAPKKGVGKAAAKAAVAKKALAPRKAKSAGKKNRSADRQSQSGNENAIKIKTAPKNNLAALDDAIEKAISSVGDAGSIAAQFETPVRKNALQVKKEIEMEENEMLEKEKAWEVPAFLRKQKKS